MLLIMIGFVFLTGAVRVCQATEFDQDHDQDHEHQRNQALFLLAGAGVYLFQQAFDVAFLVKIPDNAGPPQ